MPPISFVWIQESVAEIEDPGQSQQLYKNRRNPIGSKCYLALLPELVLAFLCAIYGGCAEIQQCTGAIF